MGLGDISMSKWDKLIERIMSLDKNLRFDEIKKGFRKIWIYW